MDKIIQKFRSNFTQGTNDTNEVETIETTYSPDELVEILRGNNKVEYVKVCLKESFSDEDEINYIWVVVKSQQTKHSEFVRSLKVNLVDNSLYEVRIQLKKNPLDTLIKDIYEKCVVQGREWGTGNSPIDNICFSLRVDAETLLKLVNWKYSIVNR
jgi:hypothetical protein